MYNFKVMTNEEKAKEIGKKHARQYHHNTFEGGLKNSEFVFSDEECMKSALEMAEWKDKEWAERFKKAFEGLWTASFNIDNLSSKDETTIKFKLVNEL